MNRRDLLVRAGVGAGALALPSVLTRQAGASPRKPGDGFKTIPYNPEDVQPYYNPLVLKNYEVDPLIWPAVHRINQSGWVWTAESCEGHRRAGAWSRKPEIRLVCRADDAPAMTWLLVDTARRGTGGQTPGNDGTKLEIIKHNRVPAGWFEARVYVGTGTGFASEQRDGLRFWGKFAEAVNR